VRLNWEYQPGSPWADLKVGPYDRRPTCADLKVGPYDRQPSIPWADLKVGPYDPPFWNRV